MQPVKKKKKGRSLEKLVAHIERVLTNNDNVAIESPKRLRDVTYGGLREHDVVLTVREGHHEIVIAIECRDRSRPITVNQVEGFWKKCQDTGVNQGIIVSPKGFCRTSKTKAQKLGIRCLTLGNALSFDWLLPPGITLFHRNVLDIQWNAITNPPVKESPEELSLVAPDGTELTLDILRANAIKKLDEIPIETLPGRYKAKFVFEPGGIRLRLGHKGRTVPIERATAEVEYEVSITLAPFDLRQYTDTASGELIADTAIAQIDVGEISGRFVIVSKAGQGGTISFLPSEE